MSRTIRNEFRTHKLNDQGFKKAVKIIEAFNDLVYTLEDVCADEIGMSRSFAICMTKLEEASFFAKKAMAELEENQI